MNRGACHRCGGGLGSDGFNPAFAFKTHVRSGASSLRLAKMVYGLHLRGPTNP